MSGGLMSDFIISDHINGLVTIPRIRHEDRRGHFEEVYSSRIASLFPNGIKQISHSHNKRNVLRGLHLQIDPPMSKIMRVVRGCAQIVHLDLNPYSSTYGNVVAQVVAEDSDYMLYGSAYIARGFLTMMDNTVIEYLHNAEFNSARTYTVAWDDPRIKSCWYLSPTDEKELILSDNDRDHGMSFESWKSVVGCP